MRFQVGQALRKPFRRNGERRTASEASVSPGLLSVDPPSASHSRRASSAGDGADFDSQLEAIIQRLDTAIASDSLANCNIRSIYEELEALQKSVQPKWRGSVLSLQSDNTLARHARLETAVEKLTATFGRASKECLVVALAGNSSILLQLLQIVGDTPEPSSPVEPRRRPVFSRSSSRINHASIAQANHYHDMLLARLRESILDRFALEYEKDKHDPALVLRNISWAEGELQTLEVDITPVFPASWSMSKAFLETYRQGIAETIKSLVVDNPGPEFFHFLSQDLRRRDGRLFEGSHAVLVEQTVSSIVKMLDEWCTTVIQKERDIFISRTSAPEVNADGRYGMNATVDLAEIVNQHGDLAAACGDTDVFCQVAAQSIDVLIRIQTQWIAVLDRELERHISDDEAQQPPPGLVEFVIALANDQAAAADFADGPGPGAADMKARFAQLRAGYSTVAYHCTRLIVALVALDVKPAAKALFTTNSETMPQILETTRDYLDDCRAHLHPTLFASLVRETLDELTMLYLHRLIRAKKLKPPGCVELVRTHCEALRGLFAQYIPKDEVTYRLEVTDHVLGLLGVSKSLLFLEFWRFAKAHGANLGFVEALLKTRDDLDWMDVSKLMQGFKKKVEEEGLANDEHSIVKRVKLPRTLLASKRPAS
ncbi:exocyst complex component Sec6-domain-containing protein [Auriculariales sp. MPI-PUGE-AT-0066]|nr:exocyst complex component Sec6-domain-containing protein [Auriculariales sp. MPI-PUGE-AT-0066]